MQRLLIATTNPGKFAEIKRFLSDLSVKLVSLDDLGIRDEIEETGQTFRENAILKAKHYAEKSGLPTVADDGGIEIDALNGEPGVHSRRWAGAENTLNHDAASDERLIAYTLDRMKEADKRGAQMRTVVAFAMPGSADVAVAEGKVRGVIALKPSNKRILGFPFRSLFFIPELNKFYNHDDMTDDENERYNHRKHAILDLKPHIASHLQSPTGKGTMVDNSAIRRYSNRQAGRGNLKERETGPDRARNRPKSSTS